MNAVMFLALKDVARNDVFKDRSVSLSIVTTHQRSHEIPRGQFGALLYKSQLYEEYQNDRTCLWQSSPSQQK